MTTKLPYILDVLLPKTHPFLSIFFKKFFVLISTLLSLQVYAGPLALEATYSSGIQNDWVRVERWKDTDANFLAEAYPPDGRGDQKGQRAVFFGTGKPHSSQFLLYYADGWDTNAIATPVLLVHGATQNADQAWANPADSSGACGVLFSCPSTGLAQELSSSGHKVFAINFPHANGDSYYWSEQIADAVEVIKNATGATEVDIVAWSKGTFSARMYVSSLKEPWGTAYRNDVRRMILVGGPNNGFDWSFRHGTYGSVTVAPGCAGAINGPAAHDTMYCFGVWWYSPEWNHNSDYFPGTKQQLKKWDSVYSPAMLEFDWYSTYYGGWGFTSYAQGIDAFLGDSLVDSLRAAGVPSSVRTHLLCGSQNDIPLLHNEHTGPSDGVIFISSCSDTGGIANVGGVATVSTNHLELGWKSAPVNQIKTWLSAP